MNAPHRCDQCKRIAFDPRVCIARFPDGFWVSAYFCNANCHGAFADRAAEHNVTLEG